MPHLSPRPIPGGILTELPADGTMPLDPTAASIIYALLPFSATKNKLIFIHNIGSANIVTVRVATGSGNTIQTYSGAVTSIVLTAGQYVVIKKSGDDAIPALNVAGVGSLSGGGGSSDSGVTINGVPVTY